MLHSTTRPRFQTLLGALAMMCALTGCHERQVTTVRSANPARLTSPDSARYGTVVLTVVREVRRPTALGRFPDGGTPRELAAYVEVAQHGDGAAGRVVGRLPLTPVRRGQYGDLLDGGWHWVAPNRLRWRLEHGFGASLVKSDSGEIEIPPLDR